MNALLRHLFGRWLINRWNDRQREPEPPLSPENQAIIDSRLDDLIRKDTERRRGQQ